MASARSRWLWRCCAFFGYLSRLLFLPSASPSSEAEGLPGGRGSSSLGAPGPFQAPWALPWALLTPADERPLWIGGPGAPWTSVPIIRSDILSGFSIRVAVRGLLAWCPPNGEGVGSVDAKISSLPARKGGLMWISGGGG